MQTTILTGLRANNSLHIGSYFGAIKKLVDYTALYPDYTFNIFVPDLHSITTEIDYPKLNDQIFKNIKLYVALGLDITKNNINVYRQSYIPAHSELAWILECFTNFGQLKRMIQFKEKSKANQESSVGLFNYPVLMAADILLYDSKYIPVGDDQTQHLEFVRDLAIKFNNKFGPVLLVPDEVKKQIEFFKKETGTKIKDLIDPQIKMSKSSQNDRGIIFLDDHPDQAYNKIITSTTDNFKSIKYDPQEQPGISNLLEIYSLLKGISIEETENQIVDKANYLDFKKLVGSAVKEFLINLNSNYQKINDQQLLTKILDSENKLNQVANAKLYQVQKAVGLRK